MFHWCVTRLFWPRALADPRRWPCRRRSAARAAGSAFASGVLWYREAQGPRLSAEPLVISRASFLGCCPPFITCVGYVAFTALAGAGGDISILSGLATLHGLFPGVAGLLCFKEPRTVLRLVGLLVAAIAIVLMGVSTDTQPRPASSWPWYARGGLFVVAICAWGLNDTLSSRIARHASLRQVMLQSGIAYLVLAACWAQVAFASASTGAGFGGMQTLVWVANFSLIFGAPAAAAASAPPLLTCSNASAPPLLTRSNEELAARALCRRRVAGVRQAGGEDRREQVFSVRGHVSAVLRASRCTSRAAAA